ncbi:hypothetical protein ABIB35_001703 [Arthrobacter sp. UYP6]
MKRRLPQYSELRELVQFKAFDPDRRRARLAKANTVWDLRDIARRRIPTAAFESVDGGSFFEHSLRRNRAAFDDVEFNPRVLRDVSTVDLRAKIAGVDAALPVGIAPTGLTRLMHSEGEVTGAQAAAFGIPCLKRGADAPAPAPPGWSHRSAASTGSSRSAGSPAHGRRPAGRRPSSRTGRSGRLG